MKILNIDRSEVFYGHYSSMICMVEQFVSERKHMGNFNVRISFNNNVIQKSETVVYYLFYRWPLDQYKLLFNTPQVS